MLPAPSPYRDRAEIVFLFCRCPAESRVTPTARRRCPAHFAASFAKVLSGQSIRAIGTVNALRHDVARIERERRTNLSENRGDVAGVRNAIRPVDADAAAHAGNQESGHGVTVTVKE